TDITVDIWYGDQIIGTLRAGFFSAAFIKGDNAVEAAAGVVFGGTDTFELEFRAGKCVSDSSQTNGVIIRGGRFRISQRGLEVVKDKPSGVASKIRRPWRYC